MLVVQVEATREREEDREGERGVLVLASESQAATVLQLLLAVLKACFKLLVVCHTDSIPHHVHASYWQITRQKIFSSKLRVN